MNNSLRKSQIKVTNYSQLDWDELRKVASVNNISCSGKRNKIEARLRKAFPNQGAIKPI